MPPANPHYRLEQYGDIFVHWTLELDGGGRSFGQEFVPVVRNLFGKCGRVFDFCAGAGFIGFSLLAANLCETLCLSDINPEAVRAMQETIRANGLEQRASAHLSDGLAQIPESERWDLVVGNPPHFCVDTDDEYRQDIIKYDPHWSIHRGFFGAVRKFLHPHASVVLIENASGSDAAVFEPYLKDGGLNLAGSFMYAGAGHGLNPHYFLWARPAWELAISSAVAARAIELPVSSVSAKALEILAEPTEKIDLTFADDTGQGAEIALQTEARGPDRILTVPPGGTRSTGPFLIPGGRLYVLARAAPKPAPCAWCQA